MAWEATCLLPPVLLVLLASGSWGQKPELLHLLEGESFSVKCLYLPQKDSEAVKFWCKWDLPRTCTLLAISPQLWVKPRNSIEDKVGRGYFIVTMTELRVEDSGSYSCGFYKSSRKFFHRNIHLVVSRGESFPFFAPAPGSDPTAVFLPAFTLPCLLPTHPHCDGSPGFSQTPGSLLQGALPRSCVVLVMEHRGVLTAAATQAQGFNP
uniref:Ig-like domain-containing protein n=1 Tax=Neovison vison TaxID=452646 RepID=A0A8C7B4Z0_NEOVI